MSDAHGAEPAGMQRHALAHRIASRSLTVPANRQGTTRSGALTRRRTGASGSALGRADAQLAEVNLGYCLPAVDVDAATVRWLIRVVGVPGALAAYARRRRIVSGDDALTTTVGHRGADRRGVCRRDRRGRLVTPFVRGCRRAVVAGGSRAKSGPGRALGLRRTCRRPGWHQERLEGLGLGEARHHRRPARHVELGEDAPKVRPDRPRTDVQRSSDRLVGVADRDHPRDLPLPRRQPRQTVVVLRPRHETAAAVTSTLWSTGAAWSWPRSSCGYRHDFTDTA